MQKILSASDFVQVELVIKQLKIAFPTGTVTKYFWVGPALCIEA
jgi:hypothetical protein